MPFHSCQTKVSRTEAEVILHTSRVIYSQALPTLAPKASENFLKHARTNTMMGLPSTVSSRTSWFKVVTLRVTVLAENLSGRKVSLLSLHHSYTTSVAHMANTGAKRVKRVANSTLFQNKDDQNKQLGNAGYPWPIIDAYKRLVTQLVIPNILSLDKSSKAWMSLIPLATMKSMTTANQRKCNGPIPLKSLKATNSNKQKSGWFSDFFLLTWWGDNRSVNTSFFSC